MAQNNTHVALIILTTQMGGGGVIGGKKNFGPKFVFLHLRRQHPFLHKTKAPRRNPISPTPAPPSAGVHVTPPPPPAEQSSGRPLCGLLQALHPLECHPTTRWGATYQHTWPPHESHGPRPAAQPHMDLGSRCRVEQLVVVEVAAIAPSPQDLKKKLKPQFGNPILN